MISTFAVRTGLAALAALSAVPSAAQQPAFRADSIVAPAPSRPRERARAPGAPAAAAAARPKAPRSPLADIPGNETLPIPWPEGPAPLPGALLPDTRIVAYYGNPLSTRMGILGQLPPEEMMAKLERTAREWAAAEPSRQVRPALHLIATTAQRLPGPDAKHRLRMSDSLIERVARWAESRGWLLFLDVQVGRSTVQDELPRLIKYLERPYVHLALDPEFAMPEGKTPGRTIGTMDAVTINWAIDTLAKVVQARGLPPKVLVVHRFTSDMITNASKIRLDPRVQVVIDMDGFGSPALKKGTWRRVIRTDPVWFTGFKLFYKNDKPMMTPAEVLALFPQPVYVQYQ